MGPLLVFYVFAGVALLAAVMVVLTRRIFHSALWLALCLICVAGLFFLLEADFIGAVQILIYVGAIVLLMIFAVMLTQRWVGGRPQEHLTKHGWGPLVASLGLWAALALVAAAGFAPTPLKEAPPAVPGTVRVIGEQLLTTYVVPFEIASVVLVMAMVAAIVLAKREPED